MVMVIVIWFIENVCWLFVNVLGEYDLKVEYWVGFDLKVCLVYIFIVLNVFLIFILFFR